MGRPAHPQVYAERINRHTHLNNIQQQLFYFFRFFISSVDTTAHEVLNTTRFPHTPSDLHESLNTSLQPPPLPPPPRRVTQTPRVLTNRQRAVCSATAKLGPHRGHWSRDKIQGGLIACHYARYQTLLTTYRVVSFQTKNLVSPSFLGSE